MYQASDEEDLLMSEYLLLQQAMYSAQDFTVWDEVKSCPMNNVELQVV